MFYASDTETTVLIQGPCDRIHAAQSRLRWNVLASSHHPGDGLCNMYVLIPQDFIRQIRESGLTVELVRHSEEDD